MVVSKVQKLPTVISRSSKAMKDIPLHTARDTQQSYPHQSTTKILKQARLEQERKFQAMES